MREFIGELILLALIGYYICKGMGYGMALWVELHR